MKISTAPSLVLIADGLAVTLILDCALSKVAGLITTGNGVVVAVKEEDDVAVRAILLPIAFEIRTLLPTKVATPFNTVIVRGAPSSVQVTGLEQVSVTVDPFSSVTVVPVSSWTATIACCPKVVPATSMTGCWVKVSREAVPVVFTMKLELSPAVRPVEEARNMCVPTSLILMSSKVQVPATAVLVVVPETTPLPDKTLKLHWVALSVPTSRLVPSSTCTVKVVIVWFLPTVAGWIWKSSMVGTTPGGSTRILLLDAAVKLVAVAIKL